MGRGHRNASLRCFQVYVLFIDSSSATAIAVVTQHMHCVHAHIDRRSTTRTVPVNAIYIHPIRSHIVTCDAATRCCTLLQSTGTQKQIIFAPLTHASALLCCSATVAAVRRAHYEHLKRNNSIERCVRAFTQIGVSISIGGRRMRKCLRVCVYAIKP